MKKIMFFILSIMLDIFLIACDNYKLPSSNITEKEHYEIGDIIFADTSIMKEQELTEIDNNNIPIAVIAGFKNNGTALGIGVHRSDEPLPFTEYIKNRTNVFEGYAPQQATLVKNGIIEIRGKYAALLICNDTSAAKTAFLNCFKEKEKSSSDISFISNSSSQTNKKIKSNTDSYNHDAVLQAYKTEDISNLSEINVCILNAAKDVISQEIKDNMSDYEKELTIHDWITNHSSFDYSVFNRSSNNKFADSSDTPYGVLIDHSAMCHGYSSTFQLFMDILDIECITVFGTPNSNGVEHSWNMVKLDGEWYCVDTAWDDPIGGNPGHNYFNVTSEHLRKGSIHCWDENNIPEATATTYAYYN